MYRIPPETREQYESKIRQLEDTIQQLYVDNEQIQSQFDSNLQSKNQQIRKYLDELRSIKQYSEAYVESIKKSISTSMHELHASQNVKNQEISQLSDKIARQTEQIDVLSSKLQSVLQEKDNLQQQCLQWQSLKTQELPEEEQLNQEAELLRSNCQENQKLI